MYQTTLGKQTGIVNKRSNAADCKSTAREPDEVDLIFAIVEIVIVTYEAVCITDVDTDTYVIFWLIDGQT